ncbi:MAG: HAD-IA family hydrolase [Luteitalea sp.]|nr:HAD-IA family hydrolase [Luteitalea sp.]
MVNVDALVLDYGGVLCCDQPATIVETMMRSVSATAERWHEAYWRYRRDYDLGLPAAVYWERVLHDLAPPSLASGELPPSAVYSARPRRSSPLASEGGDDGFVSQLVELDVQSWLVYREEVWEIARRFRARGRRVGMLSNGIPEVMARLRAERALDEWFDTVVVSYELGIVKPDPAIYQACLDRLNVAPARALFVDDRRENVDVAAQLGWQTLHFAGEDVVARLRAMVDAE